MVEPKTSQTIQCMLVACWIHRATRGQGQTRAMLTHAHAITRMHSQAYARTHIHINNIFLFLHSKSGFANALKNVASLVINILTNILNYSLPLQTSKSRGFLHYRCQFDYCTVLKNTLCFYFIWNATTFWRALCDICICIHIYTNTYIYMYTRVWTFFFAAKLSD